MARRTEEWPPELEALLREHFTAAAGFCRFLAGSEEAAKELLAEAVALAAMRFRQLRDRGKFRPWLYAIIRNRWRNTYKRRRRDAGMAELERLSASANPSREDYDHRLVDYALARLRPAERGAFVLFHLEDLSLKEAGAVLGVRPGAVKVRLHRARRRLAAALEGALGYAEEKLGPKEKEDE